jgi:alanine-glyoxylate transaminase/serine-glyoxylate transaminase/serine-pyruvate transaminase
MKQVKYLERSSNIFVNLNKLHQFPNRLHLAKQYDCLSIVDAVTSLGGIELDVDGWEIDAIYSGSQKCLSCVPGISPVSFSERAVNVIQNRKTKVQSWFLDMNLIVG